jgi:hypothetical protein
MTSPYDGLKIYLKEHENGGKQVLKEAGYAVLARPDGWKYIYLSGQFLGPVQRVIERVYVQRDSSVQGRSPEVVMFGHGKKVGVYVDGVKSELFDELANFRFEDGLLRYHGRRGKKWCYVIDGDIHGWYDKLSDRWVWVREQDGKRQIVFWAKNDGKVAFWKNDEPLELFDAELYKLSVFRWAKAGEIAFKVEGPDGFLHAEGVWYKGGVQRWFEKLGSCDPYWTEGGLRYVGTIKDENFLYFNGGFLGPYAHIEYRTLASKFNLPASTLVAIFSQDGRQFAQIGDWKSGCHQEIKKLEYVQGHRLIIGYDKVGDVELYSYYVDEQRIEMGTSRSDGYIKGDELCFKREGVDTYAVTPASK